MTVAKTASKPGKKARAAAKPTEPLPVEKRSKYDSGGKAGHFTAEKRAIFLAEYATGCTVAMAAKVVGVSVVTVFNHVRSDAAFKAAYNKVMESNTDILEDGLHHLARNGNIAAIFGTLKARRPERWRDRVDVSNQDGSILKPLAEAIKKAHGVS